MEPTVSIDIISYPEEKYKLNFLLLENDTPYAPSFEFMFNGKKEYWDNEKYLTSLYRTISNSLNKTPCHPFELIIYDVIDYKLYDDMGIILKMFNRAISMGLWEK